MTGERSLNFRGLSISFDDHVLEPRPWTEAQSAWAAELLVEAPAGSVLELCAGAGHIGLGAVRDSQRHLVMVDLNPAAQQFAAANAAANSMAHRSEFRTAELDHALEAAERFALIVADPPWVPTTDTGRFPEDPRDAIDGGDDGLVLARTCLHLIDQHLCPGGSALLQLGNTAQAQLIAADAQHLARGSLGVVGVVETRIFDRGVIAHLAR